MRTRGKCGHLALSFGLILSTGVSGLAAERILVDGSTGVMSLVAALGKAYEAKNPDAKVEMGKGLGPKVRFQALAEGKIDIAVASHGLTVEELTRQGMAVHEIARMAVVFGVNASVPVTDLSDRQVCDIYAGKVKNWSELGGPDLVIAPRARPDTEVDDEVAKAKIACLKDLKMVDTVRLMPKSGDMARELAATAGAIGVTTMAVVAQRQGKVRALSLNGVTPNEENVKRGTYGLTRESFLVTRAQPSPAVTKFLEFLRSPEGGRLIVNTGAIPVR